MVVHSAMSSSDVGALLGAAQWADEGTYVKEVIDRGALPHLAKAIKGQYQGIGVPSLSNPSLGSNLMLLSGGKTLRVAAQCVKFKEGRRVVPVGPKLAIPESYDGYFEILSEDGRAVGCIETVSELLKCFPDSCLVRESIKAFVSRSDDVDSITEKARAVHVGETLVLVGEVVSAKNGKPQQRFLRCFDQSGQNIYLPYKSKGKFSAIAKENNIDGVHSIKNLLNKRLPLMVRLIHGRPPVGSKMSQFLPELRLFAAFSEGTLAALPLGKDIPLVLLPPSAPLKLTYAKNSDTLEKTKEFLRVCERAKALLNELNERIHVYDVSLGNKSSSSKDMLFFHLSDQSKHKTKHIHIHHVHHHRSHKVKGPPDKTSVKESNAKLDDYDEIDQLYDYVRGFAPLPKHIKSPYPSADNEAIARRLSAPSKFHDKNEKRPPPPPIETIPSRKSEKQNISHEKLSPSVHPALITAALEKAERKVEKTDKVHKKIVKADRNIEKSERKVEKRLRSSKTEKISGVQPSIHPSNIQMPPVELRSSSKLFIKASQQRASKSRIFRQKSSSPVKESFMDVMNVSPTSAFPPPSSLSYISGPGVVPQPFNHGQSPAFRSRYKSLTNLVMDFDTIDSSTSGGKNSTDSCGSLAQRSKIPEKRSRRLPRPKSLTNLVWDGRGCSALPSGGGNPFCGIGPARALLEAERKMRLEPGVYRHAKDAPALLAATTRVLASQKKIGTLYL